MGLKEQMEADNRTFFGLEGFAETVSYTKDGEAPKDVVLQVFRDSVSKNQESQAEMRIDTLTLHVPREAILGIADPTLDDQIIIESIRYKAFEFLSQDDAVTIIAFVRIKPIERQNTGFRRDLK